MRWLLLAAIRAYQHHLSPHKGYCCAYRVHTGHASCSTLGYRAVRRHGVFTGLLLIRRRTWLCGVVHRRYGSAAQAPMLARRGKKRASEPQGLAPPMGWAFSERR